MPKVTDNKQAKRLERYGSSERHPFQTKLPGGLKMITESYPLKKIPRNP